MAAFAAEVDSVSDREHATRPVKTRLAATATDNQLRVIGPAVPEIAGTTL
ncbi:hypothetical protein JMUB6875_16990 [Nocardia sp. JMUB6875]